MRLGLAGRSRWRRRSRASRRDELGLHAGARVIASWKASATRLVAIYRPAWIPLRITVDRYDPKTIEPKWQKVWADEGTWEVSNEPDDRPMAYVLEMLPYTVAVSRTSGT